MLPGDLYVVVKRCSVFDHIKRYRIILSENELLFIISIKEKIPGRYLRSYDQNRSQHIMINGIIYHVYLEANVVENLIVKI